MGGRKPPTGGVGATPPQGVGGRKPPHIAAKRARPREKTDMPRKRCDGRAPEGRAERRAKSTAHQRTKGIKRTLQLPFFLRDAIWRVRQKSRCLTRKVTGSIPQKKHLQKKKKKKKKKKFGESWTFTSPTRAKCNIITTCNEYAEYAPSYRATKTFPVAPRSPCAPNARTHAPATQGAQRFRRLLRTSRRPEKNKAHRSGS